MLGWIPIIGPIIDGIVSIWKGYQQVDVAKYTVDGKVDVAAMQASANIIEATKDDIGIRLLRDVALVVPIVWGGMGGWDTIVALNHPNWMFHIAPYPDSMAYIPYAAYAFLLGNIGFNIWRRK